MLLLRISVLLFACVAFAACEDSTAKFHPGDIVVDKLSHKQGLVYSRLRAFNRQQYYLKVERSQKEIAQGASKTFVDGPYDEQQLELIRRR